MDRKVNHSKILPLILLCNSAIADTCITDIESSNVFTKIHNGKSIIYPFQSSYLIEGNDEPMLKTTSLNAQDQDLIISRSRQLYSTSTNSGSVKSVSISGNNASILFRGPNNGWHATWLFTKQNKCWFLNGLQDQST